MLIKYDILFGRNHQVDRRSTVDIIYLDFQKGFDKVPHKSLLLKLKAHGIVDGIIDWIEQWLTDRRACCSRWRGFKLEISFEWGTTRISIRTFIILNIYYLDDNIKSNVLKFADNTQHLLQSLTLMVLNNIYKTIQTN